MPILLEYTVSKPSSAEAGIDLASADEATLRYNAFPGDVMFGVGDADLSARWGWIPLLDFAAAISNVVDCLEDGSGEETLDFTESDDVIRFARTSDEDIVISATYTSDIGKTTLGELRLAVRTFAKELYADLTDQHPNLKRNPGIVNWYPEASQ